MCKLAGIVLAANLAIAAGCSGPSNGPADLVLPPGDAAQGEQLFLKMRCYDCHRIPGVDLPVAEEPNQVPVELGGSTSKVSSYADLVTSIINPSHRLAQGYTPVLVAHDGQSNMTNYNDVMTVAQLVDLVAYLEKQYGVTPPR